MLDFAWEARFEWNPHYVPAKAALGVLYANGTGVQQNFAEAAKWYRQAAEAGHIQAASNLALLYTRGQGVQRDPNEASKWNRLAASLGSAIAEDNLYWQQRGPQPRPLDPEDHEQGLKLYEAKNYSASFQAYMKAAQAGNWLAQTAVGLMYEGGEGVQQNSAQAVVWYSKAANAPLGMVSVQIPSRSAGNCQRYRVARFPADGKRKILS